MFSWVICRFMVQAFLRGMQNNTVDTGSERRRHLTNKSQAHHTTTTVTTPNQITNIEQQSPKMRTSTLLTTLAVGFITTAVAKDNSTMSWNCTSTTSMPAGPTNGTAPTSGVYITPTPSAPTEPATGEAAVVGMQYGPVVLWTVVGLAVWSI